MQEHYQLFATVLLDRKILLELDHDEDGDEEDGGCLVTQCILYSDLTRVKKGPSWTLKPLTKEFESCKNISDHSADKAVPLKIWLYPLSKLMPAKGDIVKMPGNYLDISRELALRCQIMLGRWQLFHEETDLLIIEVDKLQWIPPAVSQRAKDFQKHANDFLEAVLKSLREWTMSVRQDAGLKEETMSDMIEEMETKSPFALKHLRRWFNDYKRQMKTLEKIAQLPGVQFVSEADQLKKEIKKSYAVVLHLAGQSDQLIQEMGRYVKFFDPSRPFCWTQSDNVPPANFNSYVQSAQQFSDWVSQHNSETNNVKYFIFYDDEKSAAGHPSIRLYKSGRILSTNFQIPKEPGQVVVEENRRGVITLTWESEETDNLSGYLLLYRKVDELDEHFDSIPSNTKKM